MVTQALPQIAAEVAAPLAKIDSILIVGGSKGRTPFHSICLFRSNFNISFTFDNYCCIDGNNLVGEITKTIGALNPSVKALTGIDMAAAIGQKLTGSGSGDASKGRGK